MTEAEVERSLRRLLDTPELTAPDLEKAEELLYDLRPESPLRHRLAVEIDELREMISPKS